MSDSLSVLVAPRDGPPYQELLYREVEAAGVHVRYAEGPTPSQTLNLLLSPAALVWNRARGCEILHIHWVHHFYLPWAQEKSWSRRVMEWWFGFYLRVASAVGYAIVWTAHDLLPHEIVFADDRRARDFLLVKARVIIALSETTAADLRSLGARQVFVIPMGSYAAPYPSTMTREQARASFGFSDDDIVVTLIGRLERYKGADALLRAVASLAATSKIKVLLAGSCTDSDYRRELDSLVVGARGRVVADFHWIADENLARYLQASDIAVFPFREITNSGSINLAQSFGLPVVIPNLPNLRDIPEDSSIRFDVGVDSLLETLHRVERLSKKEYESMSKAAFAWSTREDWTGIARKTVEAYEVALHRSAPRPT